RIIWYEAPEDLNAAELFTRLNIGRIPLTDAELVKALLLSRSRPDDDRSDRSHEIAAQWDAIERDLRDPELWAFITASAHEEPTHISLLLDTLAGHTGHEGAFYTFETLREQIVTDSQGFWNSVLDLHSLLLGWYADRNLFHKIGFLRTQGVSFRELIDSSQDQLKSVFEAHLDGLIRHYLRLSESGLRDLAYDNKVVAGRALLLMNVETVRTRTTSSERYSFHEHAKGRWSLEHIHAQNAETLNRAEQWRAWLELHRAAYATLNPVDSQAEALLEQVDEVLARENIRDQDFRPLERALTEAMSQDGDAAAVDGNSIANLALLDGGDNIALSNSVFAVKRAEVLRLDKEGRYIPVCTRNVFLKYYSPGEEHQMQFWSRWDREHYLNAMVGALRPYLRPEAAESESEGSEEMVDR
ncbi:MAG TPA: DUF1524 domain-containing protein, partial [Brevibacterium sp.]|nr:DUF1524 domain-containing protein [Brevibacterium sp.]